MMHASDAEAINRQRLRLWQAHPYLEPHLAGVLILDETGDPKRGHRIELAAQQYLGKLGYVANGVVRSPVNGPMARGMFLVGVKPYRKADPAFHTKPDLAWTLIEEARVAKIPFRLVVADSVYGENALLESRFPRVAQRGYITSVMNNTRRENPLGEVVHFLVTKQPREGCPAMSLST